MSDKKRLAIYPGTFDPVTFGHLDILFRASGLYEEIILALAENSSESTLFSISERQELLNLALKTKKFRCPVHIRTFDGLLVKFAQKVGAKTLLRGLRAVSDFEYEFQMALMNRHQNPDIETVFLMPDEKYVYLSSSMVKEIGRLKGNLSAFLPTPVIKAVRAKLSPA